MVIEKVVLKESEIVEVDGQYRQIFKNEKTVPCFLTNYSLKRGKDLGLLNGSLVADVVKLMPLTKINDQSEITSEALESINELEAMKVIYLGCVGADKNLGYSFDEFVSLYHNSYEETLKLYVQLVVTLIKKDPNQFAKGLQKSTARNTKKK